MTEIDPKLVDYILSRIFPMTLKTAVDKITDAPLCEDCGLQPQKTYGLHQVIGTTFITQADVAGYRCPPEPGCGIFYFNNQALAESLREASEVAVRLGDKRLARRLRRSAGECADSPIKPYNFPT